jgi:XTP/dITP diphosphohydrolase
MKKILIATTNQGKAAELVAMLGDFGGDIEWLSLNDFGDLAEVEEDGETFAENARKKALGYAQATGVWTIADDSGLVVDALGGDPGVMSARFSGEPAKGDKRELLDHRNMTKVLELMEGIEEQKRTARFVCSLCVASGDEVLAETNGKVEGLITTKEAGSNGFGYDPIFFVPKLGKTAAQISAEQKNQISHRGNALLKLKPLLNKLP